MPTDTPRQPPLPRLDVLTADGQHIAVRGRTARLILWLAQHETEVNGKSKGELLVRFAGASGLHGQLTEVFDNL